MSAPTDPFTALLYRRVVSGQSPLLAPLFFDAAVLEKYRAAPGFAVLRTNTIGRVRLQGGWSLDFGISPQEGLIHLALGDLINRLPEAERDHWLAHLAAPPLSANFVRAQLYPGSCIEDGELRPW
jgi:hypothetical protein